MYKLKFLLTAVVFSIAFSIKVFPHVGLDYPVGGETFQNGQVVTIRWEILIYHGSCNWDLLFSTNGGTTWEPIVSNLSESSLSYEWTVPDISSNLCQIRIVQDNHVGASYNDDSNNFTISITTGISDQQNSIENFVLYPAYPNPFNPTTHIRYSIPQQSFVTLKVYDLLGNEITTLVEGKKSAGVYDTEINASGWTSGIYFYKLQAVDANSQKAFVQTRKLILLK